MCFQERFREVFFELHNLRYIKHLRTEKCVSLCVSKKHRFSTQKRSLNLNKTQAPFTHNRRSVWSK